MNIDRNHKIAAVLLALVICAAGEVATAADDAIDFRRDIQPILAARCYSCHGPSFAEAGLRLHDRTTAMAKLESGATAVVPGKPAESELLRRVSSDDEAIKMPPEGKPLAPAQVELLRRWIASGAEFRNHWAYEPVVRPPLPEVKNPAWVRNPIDAFVLAGLEHAKLTPAAPADPVAIARRLSFDLTGLPPTPEEIDHFVSHFTTSTLNEGESGRGGERENAYSELVDRLLASQNYGERWARHWLDLVRYADTNSFERDGVKPNAWKFRDYVIKSLNDDKPYDQFIREQIAGDLVPSPTIETITATGFYRLGLWDDEPADRQQARYDELDDILSTTSQVFLGLTIGCARCHDHKIDPLPQRDYYRLLAFLHEVPTYGTRDKQGMASQTDVSPPAISALHMQRDEDKRRLETTLREIEQSGIVKMSAEDQRATEGRDRKKVLEAKLADHLDADQFKHYVKLKAELEQVEKRQLPPRNTVLSLAYSTNRAPETFVFPRGNPHLRGDRVEPGFPVVLGGESPALPAFSKDSKSTGRREALAAWIASPTNPLTARVIVNRVWQFHFGRGLVRSSSNFGFASTPPTHPELLDWLADEFVRSGWSLKSLHRLILTSNTYRMSSQFNAAAAEQDPTNDRLWRFDMRRLSAEEVRDAVLATCGNLSRSMYGAGIYPQISAEVLSGQSRPGEGWGRSSPEEQSRRSVYVHVKRSLVLPILSDFDFSDTDSSCAVRFSTTQPAQALGMINGKFAHDQAATFAARLKAEAGSDTAAQVRRALRLALGRQATTDDVDRGLRLISTLKVKHRVDENEALRLYCLTVLNLNEFMYLD